jgi:[FeFe] hydrogenase (group B1/B3)
MNYLNNAALIRRELMIRLVRLFFQNKLSEIDRIPLEMFPRHKTSMRCCIYKDRAVLKYRLMALLGFRCEEETDELTPLTSYLESAMKRNSVEGPILTVIDEACSACVKNNYIVTNACQGCLARPCIMNCRKNAISMVNGQARIDPEKCVNCGICMQECSYHAIIYMPVPCEEACPVDAISKDEYGKEYIDFEKCTFCGKCLKECPFGAIMERSHIIDVLRLLASGEKTVALVAPAIIGQFSSEFRRIVTAIKRLGFDEVVEVALGADITIKKESEEWCKRVEKGESFMTSSCCPAYVETVHKHLPELQQFVSETASPMHFAAEWAAENLPGYKRIFIGPCVAKRKEWQTDELIDFVLSIEELGSLFVGCDIDVQQCEVDSLNTKARRNGRAFPVSGGVSAGIAAELGPDAGFNAKLIDGLSKKNIRELRNLPKTCLENFVEVMACEGGCIAGPTVISNPRLATRSLKKFLEESEA